MENNVYEPPESDVINEDAGNSELASRWVRLGASLLDTLLLLVILLPVQYLTGAYDDLGADVGFTDNIGYNLIMGVLSVAVYAAINYKLLTSKGQTVGKMLVGTKIVSADANTLPTGTQLVRRYSIYLGLGLIPIIGGLISLVNVLFIFTEKKTCVHDIVANTLVVKY